MGKKLGRKKKER